MSFKKFDTLKDAIQEINRNPDVDLVVFAKEINRMCCRIFIVTTKVIWYIDG